MRKIFIVEHSSSWHRVYGDDWTTLDAVWASEKCWFLPGAKVTIRDEDGNSKTFVKENSDNGR